APVGAERVDEAIPVQRILERLRAHRALERVRRLDDPLVREYRQVEGLSDRPGRLLGALEGGGYDPRHTTIARRELLRRQERHLLAAFREQVALETSVEYAVGVMDLAMAHQMKEFVAHTLILGWPR